MSGNANPEGATRAVWISLPSKRRYGLATAYVMLGWSHWGDQSAMVYQYFTGLSRRRVARKARQLCADLEPERGWDRTSA